MNEEIEDEDAGSGGAVGVLSCLDRREAVVENALSRVWDDEGKR